MKIIIGCDHVALELKQQVLEYLSAQNYEVTDLGTYTKDRCDYPDISYEVCKAVLADSTNLGILICGTGVGMSIAANKINGIRACVCSDSYTAKLTKQHNNSNVLCFGSRVIGYGLAIELIEGWLNTTYEGERHQKRLDKITKLEQTK